VVTFDWCKSAKVHDVDTVMYRLAFPKATVGYYATRDVRAEAIIITVPEMT
jgi:hypothetical protein